MNGMFLNATSFNQYLGNWDVSNCRDFNFMFDNTALIKENGLLYGDNKPFQIHQLYDCREGGIKAQQQWNALWTQQI